MSNEPNETAERPDVPVCGNCEAPLRVSQNIGAVGDSDALVAVFWCFACKHLLAFQFIGLKSQQAPPPKPALYVPGRPQ